MILPDVASTRAAIPMILITLLREEKDPKHVPGEGKVSPLQKRTTRRFADKPIIQGAKSPIAAASTALLCLSGLRRAALHLPYLEASRCSKRVIESAPDSLPLSHTLLRHLAIPDIHAFYSCKRFRFCNAHHMACLANGLAKPRDEFELYTRWPRPAARGRGAWNARLRISAMISLTRQSP